jgi:uncharacterized phage protein gp47/JayE
LEPSVNISTPSTGQLRDNIVAQVEAAIVESVPLLPKAFVRVLASALSGVFILLYKYAGWSLLQLFVAYASDQDTVINGRVVNPLKEWGRLIGVGDPEDATQAELVVSLPVTVQTGNLPRGSQFLFASSGVLYLSMAAVALNASTVQVRIKAASDQSGGDGSGSIGNLQVGDTVNLANPLPNVLNAATVLNDSSAISGADAETSDAYRARIVKRFQAKPQGGAYADYRVWGLTVPGIVNIYPYTSNTPGVVDVYVEATPASSGSPDGIPNSGQLLSVAGAIELDVNGLASNRPANALVFPHPIARVAFNFTITGLVAPDMVGAQAAISTALDQYLRSREPFIVGLSILPRLDRVTVAAASGVVDDAINAIGGSVTTVAMLLGATPTPAYTLGHGERAKAGTVTFV